MSEEPIQMLDRQVGHQPYVLKSPYVFTRKLAGEFQPAYTTTISFLPAQGLTISRGHLLNPPTQ